MEREQDVLTTSEPFDPVMAVYDGALAIKDVAAGLEEDRPGAAAMLRMVAWHLKTAAELFDDEASEKGQEAPQGGPLAVSVRRLYAPPSYPHAFPF